MLESLLGEELYSDAVKLFKIEQIAEIRIRIGRKLAVKDIYSNRFGQHIVTEADISGIIKRATKNSLYAFQEELSKGYLPYSGGIRIGIAGTGVIEKDRLITFKNITSLTVRIPHEVLGVANKISASLDPFENLLIVSPPFGGKTTMLRDIARILSNKFDTLVLDERGEFGMAGATFGDRIDFITGTPKTLAAEGAVRAMSPEVIVLDELYPPKDGLILNELARSGIKLAAGIHSDSAEGAIERYPLLKELFSSCVVLSNKPRAGSIKSVVRIQ